jgi:hypothetical protein
MPRREPDLLDHSPRPVHEDTDPPHLLALLRERRKRTRRRNTTNKTDKLPSLHGRPPAQSVG